MGKRSAGYALKIEGDVHIYFPYFDPTYLLVIPGLILGLWAQAKVKSTYHKYSRVPTGRGQGAAQVVGQLLAWEGAGHVQISRTKGTLTDH